MYRSIVDDPRFAEVVDDKAILGWYLTLLLAADSAWPTSAELPATCPADTVARLSEAGIVAPYPRGRFRMPDYDLGREDRASAGRVGGIARASSGQRDPSGRYQRQEPATAGTSEAQPLNATQRNSTQRNSARAKGAVRPARSKRAGPAPEADNAIAEAAPKRRPGRPVAETDPPKRSRANGAAPPQTVGRTLRDMGIFPPGEQPPTAYLTQRADLEGRMARAEEAGIDPAISPERRASLAVEYQRLSAELDRLDRLGGNEHGPH